MTAAGRHPEGSTDRERFVLGALGGLVEWSESESRELGALRSDWINGYRAGIKRAITLLRGEIEADESDDNTTGSPGQYVDAQVRP
jgi:hypothetical protein